MPPKKPAPSEQPPAAGFHAPPADGGLSIDRLAQAFAAMMGTGDPYAADAASAPDDLVHVDASPDLDDGFSSSDDDATCRVSPSSILEALLFVGLPGGEPLTSRKVAGLMRGVRPQEVDELVARVGHVLRRHQPLVVDDHRRLEGEAEHLVTPARMGGKALGLGRNMGARTTVVGQLHHVVDG